MARVKYTEIPAFVYVVKTKLNAVLQARPIETFLNINLADDFGAGKFRITLDDVRMSDCKFVYFHSENTNKLLKLCRPFIKLGHTMQFSMSSGYYFAREDFSYLICGSNRRKYFI